jgi:hypothetical protein
LALTKTAAKTYSEAGKSGQKCVLVLATVLAAAVGCGVLGRFSTSPLLDSPRCSTVLDTSSSEPHSTLHTTSVVSFFAWAPWREAGDEKMQMQMKPLF